jgi:hypothetical protein
VRSLEWNSKSIEQKAWHLAGETQKVPAQE